MGPFDQVMPQIVAMEKGYDMAFIDALRHGEKGLQFKAQIDAMERRMLNSYSETSFWAHKKIRDKINKDAGKLCRDMGLEMGDLSKRPDEVRKGLMERLKG